MGNLTSNILAAKAAARNSLASGIVNGDDDGGLVLRKKAVITTDGSVTANDLWFLCDLPPGAVLEPSLSYVTCSADPGTTLTLDIGHSGNTDEYADGIVLSSGGRVNFASGTIPSAVGTPRRTTTTERVYATVASADTVTSGVKLVFDLVYVVKG